MMRFLELEVFTDTPGHGNPAGVVIADGPIADAAQRAWSERVAKPGNGFLWPAGGGAWHARFHTPGREVGLSGHTSMSCAAAVMPEGAHSITLRSRTAELEFERADGALWLTLPRPRVERFDLPWARTAHALGLEATELEERTGCARTNDGDLLIPLAGAVDPVALKPDLERLALLGNELGTRGFCVFTQRVHEPSSTVQSRFFVPHLGLSEDVATGSVHGPLIVRLWELGRIRAEKPVMTFVGEQGDALGRPCRVRVEMTTEDGALTRVRVGGQVITASERPVADGEL